MYSPKDYWSSLANDGDSSDATGFAPILHPLAPAWFNQLIDRLQFHALRRALALAEISPGARFLDVGCGTGRWVRRYEELEFSAVGVDATIDMLRIARARNTRSPLTTGLAQSLPFSNATFDGLSDITVVQHIPYELQSRALQEMVRVLKPGARMILLEVICGKNSQIAKDAHVFPREPRDWIREVEDCGATLIDWFGQEFLLADRLYVRLAHALYKPKGSFVDQVQSASYRFSSQKSSVARRIYWQLRHVTVPFSVWSEPAVARICPAPLATHGMFVFRKQL
ncbi:MAG: class I SAM-dependent methyltransferase [Candidatus Acidiferrum sp.]|jgi:SAM-dependent methyltransferase